MYQSWSELKLYADFFFSQCAFAEALALYKRVNALEQVHVCELKLFEQQCPVDVAGVCCSALAEHYLQHGALLQKTGQNTLAKQVYRRGLQIFPEHPTLMERHLRLNLPRGGFRVSRFRPTEVIEGINLFAGGHFYDSVLHLRRACQPQYLWYRAEARVKLAEVSVGKAQKMFFGQAESDCQEAIQMAGLHRDLRAIGYIRLVRTLLAGGQRTYANMTITLNPILTCTARNAFHNIIFNPATGVLHDSLSQVLTNRPLQCSKS